MLNKLTVGAAQTGPVLSENITTMLPTALRMIDEASSQGVNILSFCELFLTPFFPNQLREDFDHFFIEPEHEVIKEIVSAGARHKMALIIPFSERATHGLYNSALVADSAGKTVGIYRKTHMPAFFPNERPGGTGSYEKMYFGLGTDLPVFDVDGHKIGIQICYDRQYPEGSRVLALKGAQIIFMPISYSLYGDAEHRKSAWEIPIRARAFENGVFVVAPNRVGAEGVRHHLGHSLIISPEGAILASAGTEAEEIIVQSIDLNDSSFENKRNPWWRDRRPELYTSLAV